MKPLFSICLEFVGSNINLVESFIGFPDSVAKLIFQESVKRKQFINIKNRRDAQSNLKVFFDAYSTFGILNHLCLRRCHLFVNDALIECPWILKSLTNLDLSFCGLGDGHELLPQIVSLHSLEILNLQANILTDDGIRTLTTPLRFHEKSHCLKFIDLSSNKVTTKCLHYLKSFNRLCAIDVSNSSIKNESNEFGLNLSTHNTCPCCEGMCDVITDGWAKEVMDSWNQEYYDISSIRLSRLVTSPAFTDSISDKHAMLDSKSFYRQRKPAVDVHYSLLDDKKRSTNKLILVTQHFHCSKNSNETSALSHFYPNPMTKRFKSHSPTKCTVSERREDKIKMSPLRKRMKVFSYSFSASSSSSSLAFAKDGNSQIKRKVVNDSTLNLNKRVCFDKDQTKSSGSTGVENSVHNVNKLFEKRNRSILSPADFPNDVLAFYTEAETSSAHVGTSNREKRQVSLMEQLEDWN